MIVGISSDAHFSISSSILNRVNGYKYSQRLDTLVDSYKWMYEQFKNENVELVVNCGDLTDSDLLHAEENSALYEALSYNPGINEYYILGNHEIKNKNSTISSVSVLNGYDNIKIFNNISDELINEDTHFIMVPFSADQDKYDELYDLMDKSNPDHKYYIFSHMSYIGENYNNYVVTEGLDKIRLTSAHPNIIKIFNGHIHAVKDNGIYCQVGSLISSSFGDSYEEGYPGIVILNTDTGDIKRIQNPHAILFKKISGNSIKDISDELGKFDFDNRICLRVEVPSDLKDEAYNYIEQYKDKYKIVEYRLKVRYEKVNNTPEERIELSSYKGPYDALKGFIEVQSSLPYDKEDMIKFLDTYIGG